MPRNFSKKLNKTATKRPTDATSRGVTKKKTKRVTKRASKKMIPEAEASPKSVEDIIEETFSAANTIKVLEDRNRHLQDLLDATTPKDRPYQHGKSTDYLVFGRTREQYSELIKIAAHLKSTNRNTTEAIEKIENYPLKIRDKFILLLQLTVDN